jgi:hypothetical protein
MWIDVKALFLLACALGLTGAAAPDVRAADLGVTPVKRYAVRVVHHHRGRVVRDYDGTPIRLRRLPYTALRYDGAAVVPMYEAIPLGQANPRRYFNGEPVRSAYYLHARHRYYYAR